MSLEYSAQYGVVRVVQVCVVTGEGDDRVVQVCVVTGGGEGDHTGSS